MSGFKKAKHITSYAVRMELEYKSLRYEIVAVDDDQALGLHRGTYLLHSFERSDLPHCTLDLDSVWIGRKYHRPDCFPEIDWTVSCVGNGYVGVVHGDTGGTGGCWPLDKFREEFAPLDSTETTASTNQSPFGPITADPQNLPEIVTCCDCGKPDLPLEDAILSEGKIYCPTCAPHDDKSEVGVAKEEWKPKAGEECMYPDEGDLVRVKVLHVQDFKLDRVSGTDAWITDYHEISRLVGAGCLRPIPSEPPVKVGDIVLLTRDPDEPTIAGTVTETYPEKHEFYVANWGMFNWDDSRVTITKLVPDTLYAKMKKRLVELRSEADTSRASIASAYMTELLSDLETYAKESKP